MTNFKRTLTFLFIFSLLSLSVLFLDKAVFHIVYASAENSVCIADNKDDFYVALSQQKSNIKVGNIDFGGDSIQLNYNLTISSSGESSTITNAYFKIKGAITDDFMPTIKFENIVFDGLINAQNYDLNSNQSFETIFGSEREDFCCIDGNYGYYNLIINNCIIKNYASVVGPCVVIENDMRSYSKSIEITNSKFYNNISMYNTFHLSNDKLTTTIHNCEFYNNYAYKAGGFSIANGKSDINNVKVYDNYFCEFDVNKSNLQLCGGGVFLGGTDITFSNSSITNNRTTFGGGLGVSSSASGSKQIVIENVVVKNNTATYGGGVSIHSLAGQTINFVNCDISNNTATTGSAFYTNVYAHWVGSNNGGVVNLFFCSVLLNTATDTNTFAFYDVEATKGLIGSFAIKGCFIVGNDTFEDNEQNYNYIATIDKALEDNVLPNDVNEKIATEIIYPTKNSKADVKISPNTYHFWSEVLGKYDKTLNIGKNETLFYKPFNVLLVILPCAVVLACGIVVCFVVINKKKLRLVPIIENVDNAETNDMTQDSQLQEQKTEEAQSPEMQLLSNLTEREHKVFKLMLDLKKRKEIATKLCFSEDTIKKDMSIIYRKLKVQDKFELISKYKDLV